MWYRVHWSNRPALEFDLKPFHRFSHPDCQYPMIYLGANILICLWEIFGDDVFQNNRTIAASRWDQRLISEITVPDLKVCAVNNERTRSILGVDKASLLAADLRVPQAWGLAIQQHSAEVEGIKYTSRFVDQACLALFGRPEISRDLKVKKWGALSDSNDAVDWLHAQRARLV